MAVTFVGAGALAASATVTPISVSSHANTAIGDILICQLINKSVTANAFSPPDGTWTAVITTEVNDCTTAADDHQYGLYWKRATAAGAQAFSFAKAVDDNVLFAGVISAWRGALNSGSPLDATAAVRTETVGAADNVSFPAYDPTSTTVHVIYMAYYGNDACTFAAAMSADTNPDCTLRYDLESALGNDGNLSCTSGDNNGTAIASRTWASASGVDAGSTGVVFALVAQGAVTEERDLSSAGASTVTFAGATVLDEALSSAGVSTVTFEGEIAPPAGPEERDLTSAGVSTVTFQGARVLDESLSSAGASTVTLVSGQTAGRLLSATGSSAILFDAENIGVAVEEGPAVPVITGWAGGHHLRRKRDKPIDELLADIVAEPPGLATPKERAALKRAARKARQQSDDDDAMELLLLALH